MHKKEISGWKDETPDPSVMTSKELDNAVVSEVPVNMVLTHIVNINEHIAFFAKKRKALIERACGESIKEDAFSIAVPGLDGKVKYVRKGVAK
jgi:hypothetical protein